MCCRDNFACHLELPVSTTHTTGDAHFADILSTHVRGVTGLWGRQVFHSLLLTMDRVFWATLLVLKSINTCFVHRRPLTKEAIICR